MGASSVFWEHKHDHMFGDKEVTTGLLLIFACLLNIYKVRQPVTVLTQNSATATRKKDWTAVWSSSVTVGWTLKH